MRQVNIHEAKTYLSQLIQEVAGGGAIIIANAGKPVARLVAIDRLSTPRPRGLLKGKIWIADDFDAPLPEEILQWFGASE
ncbi:MAG: type II toxin-antitoxin system Phd/YefM family antitoxin [Chloroflexota bacterium]